jgi:nitroreductase
MVAAHSSGVSSAGWDKRQERDYRHACVAAGVGGENAYLAAVARGLGLCGVGAFFDSDVDELLRLQDTPHRSLYLMGVGARQ